MSRRRSAAASASGPPRATHADGRLQTLRMPRRTKWLRGTSFHHYPNPQAFFDGVARVLCPGGTLGLRDYTTPAPVLWPMNHTERPLANLVGHGDVRAYTLDEVRAFCEASGLVPVKLEAQKKFRLHLVARKPTGGAAT